MGMMTAQQMEMLGWQSVDTLPAHGMVSVWIPSRDEVKSVAVEHVPPDATHWKMGVSLASMAAGLGLDEEEEG